MPHKTDIPLFAKCKLERCKRQFSPIVWNEFYCCLGHYQEASADRRRKRSAAKKARGKV